jgi:hypothetical protein
VKAAFNYLSEKGDNSSAIVTGSDKELVFARTTDRPLAFQFIDDGPIYFASTSDILGLETTETDSKGVERKEWYEMGDYTACAIDLSDGSFTSEVLGSYPVLRQRVTKFDPNAPVVSYGGFTFPSFSISTDATEMEDLFDFPISKKEDNPVIEERVEFDCSECVYADRGAGEFGDVDDFPVEDVDDIPKVYCNLKEAVTPISSGCHDFSFGDV